MDIITSYTLTPRTEDAPPSLSICGVHGDFDGRIRGSWGDGSPRILGDDDSFSDVYQFLKDSQKTAEVVSRKVRGEMYYSLKGAAAFSLIAAVAGGGGYMMKEDIDAQRTAALASADFQNAVNVAAHEQAAAQYGPVMARTVIDQFNAGAQTVTLNKDDFDRAVQSVAAELHPATEKRMLDEQHTLVPAGVGICAGVGGMFGVFGFGLLFIGAGCGYQARRFDEIAKVNERGLRDLEAAQAASNSSSKRDDAAGAPAPAA